MLFISLSQPISQVNKRKELDELIALKCWEVVDAPDGGHGHTVGCTLLGGASCVYSKCSARDSTDIDVNGQRNGQLHSARRSVEDRLTAY